ncbi:hypothetical protein CC78DRAFT_574136 [Lojkania enalia]|uniref:Uncharacterized protein n=1 Tax=Lojkania enalia TaxID=147567 RepID=A0A9P4TR58_9PLEO|nr:hypothetical protein CC78DRAFT_574136 [Didymosphaeria enalia]
MVIGTARIVTYKHFEKARAERAAKGAKAAEEKAKKAAKEARNVANSAPEAKGAITGTKKRGQKRKSATLEADAAALKAKAARTSEVQVAEGGQDVGAPEPIAKAVRMSNGPEPLLSTATYAKNETALEPWKALVAQMW